MSCDFLQMATPGVASLHPYQPGKPVEELERELGISNIVKLASNENPLGAAPAVVEKLACMRDYSRYPDGNGYALKRILSEVHDVDLDQITLGNGSNDILELLARAFVNPGDEVIFSEHAFAVYPLATQAVSGKPVVIPAKEWGYDLTGILAAITERTRLIFIANPNNPTGTWIRSNELEAFFQALPEHVIVVMDEAYFEYGSNEPDYPDAMDYLANNENLVVSRTFSKAHGLAALRVGYCVSHPQIADLLNRVRQPFNVNAMALLAATQSVQEQEHIMASVRLNKTGMEYLEKQLDSLGLHYIPSLGNFLSIDCQQSGVELFQNLLKEGVIVRPIANYDLPNHIRVTIGTEEENHRFIQALTHVLSN